jgi:hypothetical protein
MKKTLPGASYHTKMMIKLDGLQDAPCAAMALVDHVSVSGRMHSDNMNPFSRKLLWRQQIRCRGQLMI